MPDPAFLAGESLPASKLQLLGTEASWTPTLTAETSDPTLGTGPTQEGIIWRNGNKIEVWFGITFGTGATFGTGTYYVPIPVGYRPRVGMLDFPVGECRVIDASPVSEDDLMIVLDVANNRMRCQGDGGLMTPTSPITFADGDSIYGHASWISDLT